MSETHLLFRDDAYAGSCAARIVAAGEAGILLDRTVFYPNGGGQPGDVGRLTLADGGSVAVIDTVKGAEPGTVLHRLEPGTALPPVGMEVLGEIDWPRRHRLMRTHTLLHLLSAIVNGPVTGGQVSDGKGRLDFLLEGTPPGKDEIEAALNRLVEERLPVTDSWISDAELAAKPELVRTMSVKPPTGQGRVRLVRIGDIDLQPCGGTHVRTTDEIGAVAVTKIESKGRQNRRIALTLAHP